jgi:hypothetical protein
LLARTPGRWIRVPLLLVPVLAWLLRLTDRGGLKGAVLRILFAGLPRTGVDAWAAQYARSALPQRMRPDALAAFRAHLDAGDHNRADVASPDLSCR